MRPELNIKGTVNLARELHDKYVQVNASNAQHAINTIAELFSPEVGSEALRHCLRNPGFLGHFHYTVGLLVDVRDALECLAVLNVPTLHVTTRNDIFILATGSLAAWQTVCRTEVDTPTAIELLEQLNTMFTDAGLGGLL